MKSIVDLRASNGAIFRLQVRLMDRASAPEVAVEEPWKQSTYWACTTTRGTLRAPRTRTNEMIESYRPAVTRHLVSSRTKKASCGKHDA
jgi:hypothetical protein